jgi:hypothetical protein
MNRDVQLIQGGIDTFVLLTEDAQDWADENIGIDGEFGGQHFYSEPRYSPDIVTGMIEDGLTVWLGNGMITSVSED